MSKLHTFARALRLTALGLAGSAIISCSSSGPATSFYSLFPNKSASDTVFPLALSQEEISQVSLGVGPVILPDFIDKPAIVGLTHSSQVKVYGYHAWAGDLKEAIARVIVEDLSNHLQLDSVWAFPWDNRVRPNYQLRIEFENLSGVKGESVELLMKWTLLNKSGDKVLSAGKEKLEQETSSNSMDAYVTAMNDLVNSVAAMIAEKIAPRLSSK